MARVSLKQNQAFRDQGCELTCRPAFEPLGSAPNTSEEKMLCPRAKPISMHIDFRISCTLGRAEHCPRPPGNSGIIDAQWRCHACWIGRLGAGASMSSKWLGVDPRFMERQPHRADCRESVEVVQCATSQIERWKSGKSPINQVVFQRSFRGCRRVYRMQRSKPCLVAWHVLALNEITRSSPARHLSKPTKNALHKFPWIATASQGRS